MVGFPARIHSFLQAVLARILPLCYLLLYDFVNGYLPSCFNNRLLSLSNAYEIKTRGSVNCCFFKPLKNTTSYGLHSISYKSIYIWNKITTELREDLSSLSRRKLKGILRKYFIDSYE